MTIAYDNLYVCQDCALIIANGDMGGQDCEHGDADAHAQAMVAQWGDDTMGLTLNCGEDEDACDDFSSHCCDGCGSDLAGSRHQAVVLATA